MFLVGTVHATMSGTGMTQELEALAFEDDAGAEDLTEEEAEESARAYDEAQVVLHSQKNRIPQNRMTKMLVPVLAGGEGSGRRRGKDGRRGSRCDARGQAGEGEENSTIPQKPHTAFNPAAHSALRAYPNAQSCEGQPSAVHRLRALRAADQYHHAHSVPASCA